MTLKEKIRVLIQEGQTERALEHVTPHHSDALLLAARYNNGRKQYNMGLIEFGEWLRIQSSINWALMELVDRMPKIYLTGDVRVNQFVYITNVVAEDKPKNEYALFVRVFEALEKMERELTYPVEEMRRLADIFHKYLGTEFLDYVDILASKKFTSNSEAYRIEKMKAIVREWLELKDALLADFYKEVEEQQRATKWSELWNALNDGPTIERWQAFRDAVSERLTSPIFTDDQAVQWDALAEKVNQLEAGKLWFTRFQRNHLQDLIIWVQGNLH